ncbi:hypothetical protein [uncultured Desulfovibrio sp.]|nr:hypothetical protein [uncultured Desulfovibrio sp.]
MASLRELEEYYSYEDALNMAEIIQVRAHNEYVAAKAAQKAN